MYIASAVIVFAPYYNWQYAKENGFAKWLVFGELVPTAKAAVWPYFVFLDKGNYIAFTDAEKENLNHFSASLHADVAATDMLYANSDSDFDKANELGLKWSHWYNSDKTRAEFKVPK